MRMKRDDEVPHPHLGCCTPLSCPVHDVTNEMETTPIWEGMVFETYRSNLPESTGALSDTGSKGGTGDGDCARADESGPV